MANQTQTKSAGVAYLLWFFLGGFGAHRFYCGKTGSGFGQLGLCVGSFLTAPFLIGLLGFPVLGVWWLVDAFLIGKWMNEEGGATAGSSGSAQQVSHAAFANPASGTPMPAQASAPASKPTNSSDSDASDDQDDDSAESVAKAA